MYNDKLLIVAGVDTTIKEEEVILYIQNPTCKEEVDIIIDFSHPHALETILNYATEKSLPIVIATTGHSEAQKELIVNASKSVPVLLSANMSLGINLCWIWPNVLQKCFTAPSILKLLKNIIIKN